MSKEDEQGRGQSEMSSIRRTLSRFTEKIHTYHHRIAARFSHWEKGRNLDNLGLDNEIYSPASFLDSFKAEVRLLHSTRDSFKISLSFTFKNLTHSPCDYEMVAAFCKKMKTRGMSVCVGYEEITFDNTQDAKRHIWKSFKETDLELLITDDEMKVAKKKDFDDPDGYEKKLGAYLATLIPDLSKILGDIGAEININSGVLHNDARSDFFTLDTNFFPNLWSGFQTVGYPPKYVINITSTRAEFTDFEKVAATLATDIEIVMEELLKTNGIVEGADSATTLPLLNPLDEAIAWLESLAATHVDPVESIKLEESANAQESIARESKFSDIGGQSEALKKSKMLVAAINSPEVFSKRGIDVPKGILLIGPPGVGKTLLARTIAAEAQAKFFPIKVTDILGSWFAESELKLKAIFDEARSHAKNGQKSIVFLDELDAIGMNRSKIDQGTSPTTYRLISILLSELDGFDEKSGVTFLAATNHLENIDPALLRSGRIDTIVEIDLPTEQDLKEIFQVHIKKIKKRSSAPEELFDLDLNLDLLAQAAYQNRLSGADVENILQEVLREKTFKEISGEALWKPITISELILAIGQFRNKTKKNKN